MGHKTVGLIGKQISWKQVENAGMLVESFSSFGSTVVDGRVRKLAGGGFLPAAVATVGLYLNDPAAIAANGSDTLWLQLPVEHVDDFRVFSWLFDERGIADGEEVVAMYLPARGMFSGGKAKFGVSIMLKGSLRQAFDAVQNGQPEPNIPPVWIHAPRTPFAAEQR